MRVVVLAHPRSGTCYAAHCFQSAGWNVEHETLGHDGIASWMWAVVSREVPWGAARFPAHIGAPNVLHIMREPAAAVSSIAYTEMNTEEWRAKWVPIPRDAGDVERAVWSYLGWNLLIQAQGPTHRAQLEHVELAVNAVTENSRWRPPEGKRNDRMHAVLSADQIKATPWVHPVTAQLWDRVNAMYEEMAP